MSLLKTTCKAADRIRIMSGRVAWRHRTEQSRAFVTVSPFTLCVCACTCVWITTSIHAHSYRVRAPPTAEWLWIECSVPGSCGRGSRTGSDPACSSVPARSSPGPRYWRPPPGHNPDTSSFSFSTVKQMEQSSPGKLWLYLFCNISIKPDWKELLFCSMLSYTISSMSLPMT